MPITELKAIMGIGMEGTAVTQTRPSRIKIDNKQMAVLGEKIEEFANPFAESSPSFLINLATGTIASENTQAYLLNTLQRGEIGKANFAREWSNNRVRFLQPLKRVKVLSFAYDNAKKKPANPLSLKVKTKAESLRDLLIRMVVIISQKTTFDLRNLMSFPITPYPLSISHCDGEPLKTKKAALLKKLESVQNLPSSYEEASYDCVHLFNGGLLIHSVLSQTNAGSSLASIARSILSLVCSSKGREIHVCFDKYLESSIKGCERKLRGAVNTPFCITGPDQFIRQRGQKLLTNGTFKDQLAQFLVKEWAARLGLEHLPRKNPLCILWRKLLSVRAKRI